MSSLAAARADNFYYPRDWDPSKVGKLGMKLCYFSNPSSFSLMADMAYTNRALWISSRTHIHSEYEPRRSTKASSWFVMRHLFMWDASNVTIWLRKVSDSTQKNEKVFSKNKLKSVNEWSLILVICVLVGKYMTSTIWEFKMRCPSCSNTIIVETDPENTEYNYKEGARRIVKFTE